MREPVDAPKISRRDPEHSNPNAPAPKTLDSSATLPETQEARQANDAERMTPDEVNN